MESQFVANEENVRSFIILFGYKARSQLTVVKLHLLVSLYLCACLSVCFQLNLAVLTSLSILLSLSNLSPGQL
jgi:hypothetical protein